MQEVLAIEILSAGGLSASAVFFADHLETARHKLSQPGVSALAIALPAATSEQDDWRRSLARDLAREYAPKRVNVIGGSGAGLRETLAYLRDAPGVTGQYIALDE
ncbi:Rossmann fold domain-containing protein [Erythrobacter ani]|uniref:Short chain dehydrogenase-like proteobacteria domain-containing protein n=1 Tax=Erythrobacter ani TaxID=2827235 RepID=A0ABS6SI21_9SPHN|nr:hypothetical protein [Erythrobacter ani]MBV7264659.1 hypothetical protein [Erythrobacter ani]